MLNPEQIEYYKSKIYSTAFEMGLWFDKEDIKHVSEFGIDLIWLSSIKIPVIALESGTGEPEIIKTPILYWSYVDKPSFETKGNRLVMKFNMPEIEIIYPQLVCYAIDGNVVHEPGITDADTLRSITWNWFMSDLHKD